MASLRVRIAAFAVFFALLIVPVSALAQGQQPPLPNPPNAGSYVVDTLDWLSPAQESAINTVVAKLDSDNLAEIAVVTLDNCGDDKQKFRNDLFRTWGIGHKDKNDGLLIMVCWYGGDKAHRSLEQEVGYGLEGTIPDLLSSKVAKQYFVPAFASGAPDVVTSGKAGDALVAMVKAYDGIIRGATPKELQDAPAGTGGHSLLFWLVVLIIVIIILLVVFSNSGGGGYYSGGSSSSSSWGSSSGSSSSGSSFGGGSSGGGGSSTGF